MSVALENLRQTFGMRVQSDREMPPLWLTAPILLLLGIWGLLTHIGRYLGPSPGRQIQQPPPPPDPVGAMVDLVFFYFYYLFPLGAALFVFMLYKLVARFRAHVSRQINLYQNLADVTRELAKKKGVDLSPQISRLEGFLEGARVREKKPNPFFWTVLTAITALLAFAAPALFVIMAIPVLGVYHSLTQGLHGHERQEDFFLEDLTRGLTGAGVTLNIPKRTRPTPRRSFIPLKSVVLYIVLSAITIALLPPAWLLLSAIALPLFPIYMSYVLLRDPNIHFKQQASIEDAIITQVSPLLA